MSILSVRRQLSASPNKIRRFEPTEVTFSLGLSDSSVHADGPQKYRLRLYADGGIRFENGHPSIVEEWTFGPPETEISLIHTVTPDGLRGGDGVNVSLWHLDGSGEVRLGVVGLFVDAAL